MSKHETRTRRNKILHRRFRNLIKRKRGSFFVVALMFGGIGFFVFQLYEIAIVKGNSDASVYSLFITCILFVANMALSSASACDNANKEMYEICLELEEHNNLNAKENKFLDKYLK